MTEEDLRSLLFNEVPFKSFLILERNGETYGAEVKSETDSTYSEAVEILDRFEEHGLTESSSGRRKKIHEIHEPTDRGLELAEALREVDQIISEAQ